MQDIFTFLKGTAIHLIGFSLMSIVLPLLIQSVLLGIVQPQSGGVTPEEWANIFRKGGLIGSGLSYFLYVLWYASGLIPNLHHGKRGRAFGMWCLGFVFLLISSLAPAFLFKEKISNIWLVWATYGLNSLLPYYISTALFTPSSLRHIVPLP